MGGGKSFKGRQWWGICPHRWASIHLSLVLGTFTINFKGCTFTPSLKKLSAMHVSESNMKINAWKAILLHVKYDFNLSTKSFCTCYFVMAIIYSVFIWGGEYWDVASTVFALDLELLYYVGSCASVWIRTW